MLQIGGCSMLCPLHEFEELTKHVIPEDWEAECQTPAVDLQNDV
jgi:hypothetical protein